MLLHDSYFHASNRSISKNYYGTVVVSYSPLFHSTFTLIISILGLFFNLICSIKTCLVLYQYRQWKLNKSSGDSQRSKHVLAHTKYRFLFVLTSSDVLLSLSSIISCLDEKYFYQAFLSRHHLCAAHILIWKFTLHFTPLLTIAILCRYHYVLNKTFQVQTPNVSTLKQLLCSDLNVLIAFVLAVAWSVDGLWLWGVANINNYIKSSAMSTTEYMQLNETLLNGTMNRGTEGKIDEIDLFLPEQTTICYFLTNHNFEFSVRLIHLIQADFLLLFFLHSFGLLLEIILHIRLCCCMFIKKVTSAVQHERQLCLYILHMFMLITITSLPFYFYRIRGFIFDTSANSMANDINISRTFAQILLVGICIKPSLVLILFCPSSILFYLKYCSLCFSTNNHLLEQDEENKSLTNICQLNVQRQQQHYRYSLHGRSTETGKHYKKSRTDSNPV
ncbi:unnamed protein product [Adineta ricciae]|uniref:Uncharacterized protein n=1 Tax=Adineta ricciae TaxID=249248 RepID=A0A813Z6B6_ADIRI|nr:unnamed protein product [Adineta ricciae]CAF1151670.1 unnamed protein product [Adineta ricciae]